MSPSSGYAPDLVKLTAHNKNYYCIETSNVLKCEWTKTLEQSIKLNMCTREQSIISVQTCIYLYVGVVRS